MIDSGACTLVMPKRFFDQLGIPYELVTNGITQLDGTSDITIGVLKYLEVTLHACLGYTMLQDICVIDLPTHFIICLSRDFIAKISGGCIPFILVPDDLQN